MTDFDPSKLWSYIEVWVAGAIGAAASIRFSDDIDTFGKRLASISSGAAAAHYVTPMVMEHLGINAAGAGGVAFLLGLFGMSIAASIIRAIKSADLLEFVRGWIGRKGD